MNLLSQVSEEMLSGETLPVIREALESMTLMLSPFAPHIAEEMWGALGNQESLASVPWPSFDAAIAKEDEITLVVQIKGKVRSRIQVSADSTEDQLREAALADSKIQELTAGMEIRKVIVVPGKLVNIVV